MPTPGDPIRQLVRQVRRGPLKASKPKAMKPLDDPKVLFDFSEPKPSAMKRGGNVNAVARATTPPKPAPKLAPSPKTGRVSRPALHPTRGVPGQSVPKEVTDRLSGDTVDETVRRLGRATRRQDVEFGALINPLSGRITAMSRGNTSSAAPLPRQTKTRRRLQHLAENADSWVVQNRAQFALLGRYGEDQMAGPAKVLVHNHPRAGGRRMPSGADVPGVGSEIGQVHDSRVLSLKQTKDGPRTNVERIRAGADDMTSRERRVKAAGRVAGADIATTGRNPALRREVRTMPVPVMRRMAGATRSQARAARGANESGFRELRQGLARFDADASADMAVGYRVGRRSGSYDNAARRMLANPRSGLRHDTTLMKSLGVSKRDIDTHAAHLKYERLRNADPAAARQFALDRIRANAGGTADVSTSAAVRRERAKPRALVDTGTDRPAKPISLRRAKMMARAAVRKEDWDRSRVSTDAERAHDYLMRGRNKQAAVGSLATGLGAYMAAATIGTARRGRKGATALGAALTGMNAYTAQSNLRGAKRWHDRAKKIERRARIREQQGVYGRDRGLEPASKATDPAIIDKARVLAAGVAGRAARVKSTTAGKAAARPRKAYLVRTPSGSVTHVRGSVPRGKG